MKIVLKDKTLTVRKWKGKDKKRFMNLMQQPEPDEDQIMQTLVYNCIESAVGPNGVIDINDIILSTDEFKYTISMIRSASLGDEIEYNFYCTECSETKKRIYNITDIIKGSFGDGESISADGVEIILGGIRNKEYYLEKLKEGSIFDFFLRIKSINGNDSFDLDFLIDFFDDLDIDIIDDVLGQYDDIRFKVDDVNEFVCDCGHTEKFHFDELPEFFPSEWFNEESLISSFK